MKLDFISQPSSKSTLPFAGLQHMQLMPGWFPLNFCFHALIQMNGTWKMVSTVGGLNPRLLSHESSALTTWPWLLACLTIKFPLPNITQVGRGNCWSVVKQDTSWIFNFSWLDVWQLGRRSNWHLATVSFLFCGIKRIISEFCLWNPLKISLY